MTWRSLLSASLQATNNIETQYAFRLQITKYVHSIKMRIKSIGKGRWSTKVKKVISTSLCIPRLSEPTHTHVMFPNF